MVKSVTAGIYISPYSYALENQLAFITKAFNLLNETYPAWGRVKILSCRR